jgi:hypothetical protein
MLSPQVQPDWCAELPTPGDASPTKLTVYKWHPESKGGGNSPAAAAIPSAEELFASPQLHLTMRDTQTIGDKSQKHHLHAV